MSKRFEFEERLLDSIQAIVDEYKQYNPSGKYLDMTFSVDEGTEYISVRNECWHGGNDQDCVIDATRKKVQK